MFAPTVESGEVVEKEPEKEQEKEQEEKQEEKEKEQEEKLEDEKELGSIVGEDEADFSGGDQVETVASCRIRDSGKIQHYQYDSAPR